MVRREERVVMSLSEEEKNILKKSAKENHLPLATYCRFLVFGRDPVNRVVRTQRSQIIERLPKNPSEKKLTVYDKAFFEVQQELMKTLKKPKQSLKKIPKRELLEYEKRKDNLTNLTPDERRLRCMTMSQQFQELKFKNLKKAKVI